MSLIFRDRQLQISSIHCLKKQAIWHKKSPKIHIIKFIGTGVPVPMKKKSCFSILLSCLLVLVLCFLSKFVEWLYLVKTVELWYYLINQYLSVSAQ